MYMLPAQQSVSQVMKFWSMTWHCLGVEEPAEPETHFKWDIFFSLTMPEIYVAIYFLKLLPFS